MGFRTSAWNCGSRAHLSRRLAPSKNPVAIHYGPCTGGKHRQHGGEAGGLQSEALESERNTGTDRKRQEQHAGRSPGFEGPPSLQDINHRAIATDQAQRLLASQGIHQADDPARQGCQLTPVCQHGINRLSERAIKNRRLGDIPSTSLSTSRQPEPRVIHQCPSQPRHTPHEVNRAHGSRLPMVSAAGEQYIDRGAIQARLRRAAAHRDVGQPDMQVGEGTAPGSLSLESATQSAAHPNECMPPRLCTHGTLGTLEA